MIVPGKPAKDFADRQQRAVFETVGDALRREGSKWPPRRRRRLR